MISKQKIFDSTNSSTSNVVRASVVKIAGESESKSTSIANLMVLFSIGSACLTCYLSTARIHVYSLPSLRELFNMTLDSAMDSFK